MGWEAEEKMQRILLSTVVPVHKKLQNLGLKSKTHPPTSRPWRGWMEEASTGPILPGQAGLGAQGQARRPQWLAVACPPSLLALGSQPLPQGIVLAALSDVLTVSSVPARQK